MLIKTIGAICQEFEEIECILQKGFMKISIINESNNNL